MLTWTALGLAVVAAPTLWSRPTARWPGTRALTALLALLAIGAALALAAPAPQVILASAIVYGATFMGVPAAVTTLSYRRMVITEVGDRMPDRHEGG